MKLPQMVAASVCLLVLIATSAHAENPTAGVLGGVTASRFSPGGSDGSITLGPGGVAGLYAVLPITKSISLMPELEWVGKYASRTGSTLGDARIDYVELPILVKMPFYWGTYFAEGIGLGWPMGVGGFAQHLSDTTSPDFSIIIGGGHGLGHHGAIEFRYDGGVRRVSTRDTDPIQRTRSFMLMLKFHL